MHILTPALAILTSITSSVVASESWAVLPPLPNARGFAGCFAGVSHDCLLVAGGANFPDTPPWEGGRKVWSAGVFLLDRPEGDWILAGALPGPRAYGVSITTDDGLLCIGGSDSERHHTDCFLVKWADGKLKIEPYPPLPLPLAESCGALLGRTVHVVGGTREPGASTAEKLHLTLNLDTLEKGWQQEIFPGPARILAVSAIHSGAFFVMSGAALAPDADGKPKRTYLRDAWRYDPETGWKPIADMPRPALAAPSPAPLSGGSLQIIGGDDGSHAGFQPPSAHPGFSRSMLSYDPRADLWREQGKIPEKWAATVTTPVTVWRDLYVIPSGEIRPATRTPQVLTFTGTPPIPLGN